MTGRSASAVVVIALVSLLFASSAAMASPRQRASFHCRPGYKVVARMVRRHGASKELLQCVRKEAATPPAATAAPATVPTPTPVAGSGSTAPVPVASAASPEPVAVVPPAQNVIPTPVEPEPEPELPTHEETSGSDEGVTVRAYLYPRFAQNPLAPDEVTWRYSASATRTTTEEEVEKTEPTPLPTGVLVFYVDGHLECETHVGGHVASDTCTAELPSLGVHEVEVIYSAGALWSTKARTDTIGKYPTTTSLEAVSEPVPPRKRTLIKGGYSYIRTEVGQLRVTDVATPAGYPEFDCEGQPKGCVIPVEGTERRDGSVYFPLWGSSEVNTTTWETEYWSGLQVYEPIRERQETIWDPARFEQANPAFFHVVSEPNTRYYLPSSATVPLDLSNVHFPFYRTIEGNPGGVVEALETPMTKVLTFGTYDKLGGSNTSLIGELSLNRVYEEPDESEGCEYEVRIDGIESWRVKPEWRTFRYSAWPYWKGLPAGPHTATLWVGREAGTGPGKCELAWGHLELYEHFE